MKTETKDRSQNSSRKELPKAKFIKGTVEHKKALGGNNAPAANVATIQQILGAMGSNQEGLKQLMSSLGGKNGLDQGLQHSLNALKEALSKPQ